MKTTEEIVNQILSKVSFSDNETSDRVEVEFGDNNVSLANTEVTVSKTDNGYTAKITAFIETEGAVYDEDGYETDDYPQYDYAEWDVVSNKETLKEALTELVERNAYQFGVIDRAEYIRELSENGAGNDENHLYRHWSRVETLGDIDKVGKLREQFYEEYKTSHPDISYTEWFEQVYKTTEYFAHNVGYNDAIFLTQNDIALDFNYHDYLSYDANVAIKEKIKLYLDVEELRLYMDGEDFTHDISKEELVDELFKACVYEMKYALKTNPYWVWSKAELLDEMDNILYSKKTAELVFNEHSGRPTFSSKDSINKEMFIDYCDLYTFEDMDNIKADVQIDRVGIPLTTLSHGGEYYVMQFDNIMFNRLDAEHGIRETLGMDKDEPYFDTTPYKALRHNTLYFDYKLYLDKDMNATILVSSSDNAFSKEITLTDEEREIVFKGFETNMEMPIEQYCAKLRDDFDKQAFLQNRNGIEGVRTLYDINEITSGLADMLINESDVKGKIKIQNNELAIEDYAKGEANLDKNYSDSYNFDWDGAYKEYKESCDYGLYLHYQQTKNGYELWIDNKELEHKPMYSHKGLCDPLPSDLGEDALYRFIKIDYEHIGKAELVKALGAEAAKLIEENRAILEASKLKEDVTADTLKMTDNGGYMVKEDNIFFPVEPINDEYAVIKCKVSEDGKMKAELIRSNPEDFYTLSERLTVAEQKLLCDAVTQKYDVRTILDLTKSTKDIPIEDIPLDISSLKEKNGHISVYLGECSSEQEKQAIEAAIHQTNLGLKGLSVDNVDICVEFSKDEKYSMLIDTKMYISDVTAYPADRRSLEFPWNVGNELCKKVGNMLGESIEDRLDKITGKENKEQAVKE